MQHSSPCAFVRSCPTLATANRAMPLLLLSLLLLLLAPSAVAQDHLDPFPNATAGSFFSGVFSDGAVLQRGGKGSSLYGVVIGAVAGTTVTVKVSGSASYTIVATVDVTPMKVKSGIYARWRAVLKPHAAGGDYTASVDCANCGTAAGHGATLANLTMGDVWFCSGQSNVRPLAQPSGTM